jgi:MFS family permease
MTRNIGLGMPKRAALVVLVLVASAFIWYFYATYFLFDFMTRMLSSNDAALIYGINFLAIAASAVTSVFFLDKFRKRRRFIYYWIFAGLFLSVTPMVLQAFPSFVAIIFASAVLGSYFGLGIPACMGYFAAATEPSNRARLGGITALSIGLGIFILAQTGYENATIVASVLFAFRLMGLVLLFVLKMDEKKIDAKAVVSYREAFTNRAFILYLVPWFVFTLINQMAFPIFEKSFPADLVTNSGWIENALMGIFAVVFGFMADFVGRKRLILSGFALMGVGYAVLSFSQTGADVNFLGWYFYTIVDGVAWGAFMTLFLTTVWGDLAQGRSSERLYALGALPYLFSNFARQSIGTIIASSVSSTTVFSFASFFLFLAVLPLVYAPETLPEKVMKDRDLKSYVEKAKKKMLVEIEKPGTENTPSVKNEAPAKDEIGFQICPPQEVEVTEGTEGDAEEVNGTQEEAERLAEKYY